MRLPWCSRMRVHEVVAQDEAVAEVEGHLRWPLEYVDGDCALQSGRLVALADRRIDGMDMRAFELFEGEMSLFWDVLVKGAPVFIVPHNLQGGIFHAHTSSAHKRGAPPPQPSPANSERIIFKAPPTLNSAPRNPTS